MAMAAAPLNRFLLPPPSPPTKWIIPFHHHPHYSSCSKSNCPQTCTPFVPCPSVFRAASQLPPQTPVPKHKDEPLILRLAVSTVTQLLRVFGKDDTEIGVDAPNALLVSEEDPIEVQQIVNALRDDYGRSYFLTGDFTRSLYAENCDFADPTIRFTGRDLYERNLKLLVPFFEEPSVTLSNIEEGVDEGACFIKAYWKLRTYLKLPWRPLVAVDGSTTYTLDGNMKIVKHVESWSISAFQAILQIFVPSSGSFF